MNTTQRLIMLAMSDLQKAIRTFFRREALRHRFRQEYRTLNSLEDHIFKDIGITRDQLRSAQRDLNAGQLPEDLRPRNHL